jgi:hypothetical protein
MSMASERVGSGVLAPASLEESPLLVLKSIPRFRARINQRIERAGMLPARFRDFAQERSSGFADPDTSRAIRPLTRMAGDTRIWRTNGFDCCFL